MIDPDAGMPDPGALLTADMAVLGPMLASRAVEVFGPVIDRMDALRSILLNHPQRPLLRLPDRIERGRVVAVDGALLAEKTYAADLVLAGAAAFASEGTSPAPAAVCDLLPRRVDTDRFAAAAMAVCEITVAHRALGSGTVWLDGSITTPLIALARGLGSGDPVCRDRVANLIGRQRVPAALADLLADGADVVALPKSDTRNLWADWLAGETGEPVTGGDRFLATQLLHPGEILWPRPGAEAGVGVFRSPDPSLAGLCRDLDEATEPLVAAAGQGRHLVTYVKSATGRMVTKLEYRADGTDRDSVETATIRRASQVAAHVVAGILEPVPQWAADRAAKRLSAAAAPARRALVSNLPDEYLRRIGPWLHRDHRTSGGG